MTVLAICFQLKLQYLNAKTILFTKRIFVCFGKAFLKVIAFYEPILFEILTLQISVNTYWTISDLIIEFS